MIIWYYNSEGRFTQCVLRTYFVDFYQGNDDYDEGDAMVGAEELQMLQQMSQQMMQVCLV